MRRCQIDPIKYILAITLIACTFAMNGIAAAQSKPEVALIGQWDLTVKGASGSYPSWLEIRKSGTSTLVGGYVGQFGSVRPISKIEVVESGFRFTVPPQWERRKTDVEVTGRLDGEILRGEVTDDKGAKVTWEGKRAPALDDSTYPIWGEPINLFNGHDLSGWKPRDASKSNGWKVKEIGVTGRYLVNAIPGNDLVTEAKFKDFQLIAEFRYPKGSNSGLYLRGRYEVQIEDNFGDAPESHKIGGVYGFLTPSFNAAKPADEWQKMELTLIGRRVTVVLNDRRILDQQLIPGITGGALDSNEGEPGPVMIQGDHGPVEFRKLVLSPAKE